MSYLYLILAIVLEVLGTTSMKFAEGFTKLVPSILVFVFYIASLAALTMALKKLEVSVTYAIWSGLGTVMIAAIGVYWFNEPMNAIKVGSIGLIIIGVVGLNLGGAH